MPIGADWPAALSVIFRQGCREQTIGLGVGPGGLTRDQVPKLDRRRELPFRSRRREDCQMPACGIELGPADAVWPRSTPSSRPPTRSHRRMLWSSPQEPRRLPSALKARRVIIPVCPVKVRSSLPEARSRIRMVPSLADAANHCPSGLKAASVDPRTGQLNSFTRFPSATVQALNSPTVVLSVLTVIEFRWSTAKSCSPAGSNATVTTRERPTGSVCFFSQRAVSQIRTALDCCWSNSQPPTAK